MPSMRKCVILQIQLWYSLHDIVYYCNDVTCSWSCLVQSVTAGLLGLPSGGQTWELLRKAYNMNFLNFFY